MFTGIVQDQAEVKSIDRHPGHQTLCLSFPPTMVKQLACGASIAIEGTCLTVTQILDTNIYFDVIAETLTKTTLGLLKPGDTVNVERSARFGDEIGGHLVSGHVHGMGHITQIDNSNQQVIVHIRLPKPWIEYVFPKGFIALAGASLTIVEVDQSKQSFTVHLIPETLARTTFSQKQVGDAINFEVETNTLTIVETVKRVLNKPREMD